MSTTTTETGRRRGNCRFFLVLGAVALVIAGVVSFYASSHPDGLEHVAESTGFSDTADVHGNADGPLADYAVKGIDNERLSGGLAGVIGVGVTLVIAGGLAFVVRRRGSGSETVDSSSEG